MISASEVHVSDSQLSENLGNSPRSVAQLENACGESVDQEGTSPRAVGAREDHDMAPARSRMGGKLRDRPRAHELGDVVVEVEHTKPSVAQWHQAGEITLVDRPSPYAQANPGIGRGTRPADLILGGRNRDLDRNR